MHTQDRRFKKAQKAAGLSVYLVVLILAVCLEGALRKWLLPVSLHSVAYLAKDAVALAIIVRFPVPRDRIVIRRFRDGLLLSAALLIPSLYWGLQVGAGVAVLTAKNAVLWPIFAAHAASALDLPTLERVDRTFMLLGIGVAVLAVAQFSSSSGSALNQYVDFGSTSSIAGFADGSVRATGTFSYISGLAAFGAFLFANGLAQGRLRFGLSSYLSLGASVLIILTSGSRAPAVLCALTLALFLMANRQALDWVRVVLGFILIVILLSRFLGPVVAAYQARATEGEESFSNRAIEPLTWFWDQLDRDVAGVGLGVYSPTSTNLTGAGPSESAPPEDSRARAAAEGGVLAILFLTSTLLLSADALMATYRRGSKETKARIAAYASLVLFYVLSCTWYDHNMTAFTWIALAISISGRPTSLGMVEPNVMTVAPPLRSWSPVTQ